MLIVPQHIIEETMQEVITRWLIPKFNELGMNATGEWLNNIEVKTGDNKGEIWARKYSEQLALGRMPGNRPPITPIERWVNVKLGISGNEGKSVAFAIANKIAKEGTSWYQKGGSDLIEVLEQPDVIEFVNSKIGDYLSAQARLQIVRDLKEVLV